MWIIRRKLTELICLKLDDIQINNLDIFIWEYILFYLKTWNIRYFYQNNPNYPPFVLLRDIVFFIILSFDTLIVRCIRTSVGSKHDVFLSLSKFFNIKYIHDKSKVLEQKGMKQKSSNILKNNRFLLNVKNEY